MKFHAILFMMVRCVSLDSGIDLESTDYEEIFPNDRNHSTTTLKSPKVIVQEFFRIQIN